MAGRSLQRSQEPNDLQDNGHSKIKPWITGGTGKSHFVEALAHTAIDKDLRVAWFTLESLAAAVGRARIDGSVARTVARICRCDLRHGGVTVAGRGTYVSPDAK